MNVKILMSAVMLGLLLPCSAFTQEQRAYAELKGRDGKSIGMATFREVSGGVVIDVDVKGLTPGLHAVHVHTIGKCEGPAFTSRWRSF
jgi:superoxide dismutase, Cu-Zn family